MASSPSEFLTFYRHINASAAMRSAMRSTASRSFSTSRPQFLGDKTNNTGDMGENTRHVLEKGKDKENNVQAYESNQGIKNQQQGTGGNATARDSGGANEKARKTHPEAPDNIGMQDERGGKW